MAINSGRNVRWQDAGFSAPVAREFVHRWAVSEVFVTGIRAESNGTYSVFAQWPRWHVFYGLGNSGFDSALIVETLRQLTIFIAHTQLGVPLGMQFLMSDLSASKVTGAVLDPTHPTDVTVHVQVSNIKKSRQGVGGLQVVAFFDVDGHQVAQGTAGARIVDPEAYRRLRSRKAAPVRKPLPAPMTTASIGHGSSRNVVLGASLVADCWPLRADETNPIFFDHPLDHIPGALLIEAVRQVIRAASGLPDVDLETLDARFLGIVEFSDEAVVCLESLYDGPQGVKGRVTIQAAGKVLMFAVAGFTEKPPSWSIPRHLALQKQDRSERWGHREDLHA